MPRSFFLAKKTYVFFSHTIKGQKANMPMLNRLRSLGCHLVDYEKVINNEGKRLLFFGRYAGIAGMMETFHAFGKKLALQGVDNPFSSIEPAYRYGSVHDIENAVRSAGEAIRRKKIHPSLVPMIFGFTGYGHVSLGAQEIFDLLPVIEISPDQLLQGSPLLRSDAVYKVVFKEEHMVRSTRSGRLFNLEEYYAHPENFCSVFESYLPFLSVLINAIFWTPSYPRLVTRKALKKLFESEPVPRLRVIGDITCDIDGSVECTVKTTTPDNPVFVYDPIKDLIREGLEGRGVVVMAVDNLPCELPAESSLQFGNALLPFVPEIVKADYTLPFDRLDLSPCIKNALIVYQGRLAPEYMYLEKHL